jgi:hypothetical protein
MNSSTSVITLTFGDSAENHVGMEKIGSMVSKGEGYTPEDLHHFAKHLPGSEVYTLSISPEQAAAAVLVVRGRHRYHVRTFR